jgi:hypothetical protein
MASCSCSTLLTSSSKPFRTWTFRPSLRTPSRHRSLPLPGLSVQPAPGFCFPHLRGMDGCRRPGPNFSLQVLRCLGSGKPPPPPAGGGTGSRVRKAAAPVHGRGGFRAAPFHASCGLAFATVAGVLMLQGSQQAFAATEFAGLLPAGVLGDLGDISTGFASVRTPASASLCVPNFFFCVCSVSPLTFRFVYHCLITDLCVQLICISGVLVDILF